MKTRRYRRYCRVCLRRAHKKGLCYDHTATQRRWLRLQMRWFASLN
jgi:hypothetical protein